MTAAPQSHAQRAFAAIAVISVALCVMMMHQVERLAPLCLQSAIAFMAPGHGMGFSVAKTKVGVMDFRSTWTPRIFSLKVGYAFTRGAEAEGKLDMPRFARKAGLYVAVWLGLIFLLYLMTLRERALLPILGTYCAVAFGYMPGIVDRVMPWDMPALFFYTLFICLLIRGNLKPLLFIMPIAVAFKETAALLALAFLFTGEPRARRLRQFALALALAVAARLAAARATHTLGGGIPGNLALLWANLRYCVTGAFPHPEWYIPLQRIDHPLLINAGLFTAFLLAPPRDRNAPCLWSIFIIFTGMMLLSGVIFEYRIWFELIPISLYPFYAPIPESGVPAPIQATETAHAILPN